MKFFRLEGKKEGKENHHPHQGEGMDVCRKHLQLCFFIGIGGKDQPLYRIMQQLPGLE